MRLDIPLGPDHVLGNPAFLVLPAVEVEGQDDVQLVAVPCVDAREGLVLPLIVLAPNLH